MMREVGGETDGLCVDILVIPVVEQEAVLTVVVERLLLAVGHVDNERSVQPPGPLHSVVVVVEVRSSL